MADDPLLVPVDWDGERASAAATGAGFDIVEDQLLEPWAEWTHRGGVQSDARRDCDGGGDCVCSDLLTPPEWMR